MNGVRESMMPGLISATILSHCICRSLSCDLYKNARIPAYVRACATTMYGHNQERECTRDVLLRVQCVATGPRVYIIRLQAYSTRISNQRGLEKQRTSIH